jgi:ribosomal protein L37AE/L43A
MVKEKEWVKKKLINPCNKCKSTDIRRIHIDPVKDIWICYKCGQAQYIKK